jgi:hypothetical protein
MAEVQSKQIDKKGIFLMSKKQLNEFKRRLRNDHEQQVAEYDTWKSRLYEEPDGFLGNCEANFHLLESLIPDEALHYFEDTQKNPLFDDSEQGVTEKWRQSIEAMQQYVPTFLENFKRRFTENDKQLSFMYYWLLLDNGTIELKRLLSQHFCSEFWGGISRLIFRWMVGIMVRYSVNSMMVSKKEWSTEVSASQDSDEREAITETLATVKSPNKGRADKDEDLRDLLLGGKKEYLFAKIEELVAERPSDSALGSMLFALEKARCVTPCDYTTFHRALKRAFPDVGIGGCDRPQQIYGKLKSGLLENFSDRRRRSVQESYNAYLTTFVELSC